jgi:hypothetical protein
MYDKFLSIEKFSKYVMNHFQKILFCDNPETLVEEIAYYCSYEKRKDRCNFFETLGLLYLEIESESESQKITINDNNISQKFTESYNRNRYGTTF